MILRRSIYLLLAGLLCMGFTLEAAGADVFRVNLVPVNKVVIGKDADGKDLFPTLKNGFVAVNEIGEVTVAIEESNLVKDTALKLFFVPFGPEAEVEIGPVTIGEGGSAAAKFNFWTEPVTLIGLFVIGEAPGTEYYATGFSVTPEPPEPPSPPEPPLPPDEPKGIVETVNDIIAAVNGLSAGDFKNPNNKDALINKLNAVLNQVSQGAFNGALNKLQNDILGKTDGCAGPNGKPDKNDWIINCTAQDAVYPLISAAIMVLEE